MACDGYVLVVDDDGLIRDFLVSVIGERYKLCVKAVSDGRAALNILLDSPPPLLILIDIMMPIMDGIEFIRQKDLQANWADIPVCVMTASAVPLVDLSGIVSVLRKPFDVEALMSLVERYC